MDGNVFASLTIHDLGVISAPSGAAQVFFRNWTPRRTISWSSWGPDVYRFMATGTPKLNDEKPGNILGSKAEYLLPPASVQSGRRRPLPNPHPNTVSISLAR